MSNLRTDLKNLLEQMDKADQAASDLWSWLPSFAVAKAHHGDYVYEYEPENAAVMAEACDVLAAFKNRKSDDPLPSCPCGEDHLFDASLSVDDKTMEPKKIDWPLELAIRALSIPAAPPKSHEEEFEIVLYTMDGGSNDDRVVLYKIRDRLNEQYGGPWVGGEMPRRFIVIPHSVLPVYYLSFKTRTLDEATAFKKKVREMWKELEG